MSEKTPTVPELLDALRGALKDRALQFSRVGGEIALVIVGHEPPDHTVRLSKRGVVEIVEGKAKAPIATIGIKPSALAWLIEGTLDVERAFEKRRLAVEGDVAALGRFAECFRPSGSILDVRRSKG